MSDPIYLIYKHTSPSGKSYIGLTKDYERRCNEHQTYTDCIAFNTAIKKYGWDNFTHEILIDNISIEEANTLEEYFIKEHNTLAPNGYNLTTGGKAYLLSEETKQRMSIAKSSTPRTAEHTAKLLSVHKGKIVSEKTKAKLSAARKTRIVTDETKAKLSRAASTRVRPPCSDETKAKLSAKAKARHTQLTFAPN